MIEPSPFQLQNYQKNLTVDFAWLFIMPWWKKGLMSFPGFLFFKIEKLIVDFFWFLEFSRKNWSRFPLIYSASKWQKNWLIFLNVNWQNFDKKLIVILTDILSFKFIAKKIDREFAWIFQLQNHQKELALIFFWLLEFFFRNNLLWFCLIFFCFKTKFDLDFFLISKNIDYWCLCFDHECLCFDKNNWFFFIFFNLKKIIVEFFWFILRDCILRFVIFHENIQS